MWLNPLPAETVIGAIIGAVLGTIIAQSPYFEISEWMQARYPLLFTFLILSYGVSIHFYCAAVVLDRPKIRTIFLALCLLIFLGMVFYPKEVGIDPGGRVSFLPESLNVLIAGTLMIWLVALRAMAELHRLSKSAEV
jgi:hypothetical protein